MDINLLISTLLRRSWLLIIIPLISGISSYYFTKNLKEKFKSTAQIATGYTQRSDINLTDEAFSLYEADVKFNNLIENLNSRLVYGMLSYRLLKNELEGKGFKNFRNPEIDRILQSYGQDNVIQTLENKLDSLNLLSSISNYEKSIENLLIQYNYDHKELQKVIYTGRVRNTDYINVISVTENPNLSAYIVNILIEEFFRFHKSNSAELSEFSVEFLLSLVNQKKEELQDASNRLEYFKKTNNFLDVNIESQSRMSQMSHLENEKTKKIQEIKALQFNITDIQERLKNTEDANNAYKINEKILELQKKIDLVNAKYALSNFSDNVLLDSVNFLRELQRNEISKARSAETNNQSEVIKDLKEQLRQNQIDLKMATEALLDLENQLQNNNMIISSLASKEATIAALQREVDLATQEYLNAQEKYNTAKNKSLILDSNIKQILYGQPALEPEGGNRLILIALSMAGSFAFVLVVIIGLELLDQRIRTPSLFKQQTNLPLIGVLNELKVKKMSFEIFFKPELSNKQVDKYKHLLRKIRYDISNSRAKTILFTSTKRGEGKSFVLFSIAHSFSQINKRVLIVDTNFRNNTLTVLLSPKVNPKLLLGTFNYESSHADQKNEETDNNQNNNLRPLIIKRTSFKGIDTIGNNGADLSPSEVFAGKNFNTLLNELKNHYDYIFLEGSALNDYSDSKELVDHVDKVVGIFSANSVIKNIDKESISFLTRLNSKFLGGILNIVEKKFIEY